MIEKPTNGEIEAVQEAIRRVGSQAALARAIGLSQPTISGYASGRYRVRADKVLAIERATGVPRHEIRPDLYPLADA